MLQFNESLLEGLYSKNNDAKLLGYFCNIMPTLHLNSEDRRVIEGLMYRMMKELKEKAIGHEVYLKTLTIELLLYLLRCKDNYDMMGQPVESSLHRKVSEIADYIQTHYTEPLTLSHLSKAFYISTYYLSRVFKEIIGLSFVEYLNRTRIKEAQRLLGRSGMKIISISDQVGFDSATHFGRVFKQITGLSPTCYRRLHHEEHQEDNKTCQ
jgi:YesN/AraC family two-component response regulator